MFTVIVPQATTVNFNICGDFGHAIFNNFELRIGGTTIDIQYSKWLTIWRDLTEVNPYFTQGMVDYTGTEPGIDPLSVHMVGVNSNVNLSTRYQRMSYTHTGTILTVGPPNPDDNLPLGNSSYLFKNAPTEIYIPLRFWFCKNPGLALPLIALQNHDVQLYITFSGLLDIINPNSQGNYYTSPVLYNYDGNINVYADYIFWILPNVNSLHKITMNTSLNKFNINKMSVLQLI